VVPVVDKVMPLLQVHAAGKLRGDRAVFGKIVLTTDE